MRLFFFNHSINSSIMHKIILTFIIGVMAALPLRAQRDRATPLPADPETVVGKLPNGITYYLRHNETPRKQACFYIIRNAGSLMEEEGEEGLAHFLEHMSFQGTENFPGRGVVETLERHGVLYGYDINAVTSENETVYNISGVPTDDKKLLDSCVMILRDWSYYLTLDEAEIDEERKVIAEEWNTHNTPQARIQEQIAEVLFKGSKYVGRDVIGKLEVIQNFDPQALRDFYHRWYRTDLEAVVIVGDFDMKEMEKRVKKYLSDVPAVKNPEPRPFYSIPEHEEMYYCMATDAGAQGSGINVITLIPDTPEKEKNTTAYLKEQVLIKLFNAMTGKRMSQVLADPNGALAKGGISYIFFKRGYYTYQLGAVPRSDEASALQAILTENERLLRYGFTEEELRDAKKDFMKQVEYAYRGQNNIKNDVYAQLMRDNFLKGEPLVPTDYECAFMRECVPAITVEEMNAKVRKWNTEKNRTFVVTGSETAWHLMEDEVKDIMAEVKAAEIEPYRYVAPVVDTTPLLPDTLKGAKVVAEKDLPAFGAVEWTLGNGAKVVFRHSELDMNQVSLKAYSPGGTSLYDLDMLPSAEVSAQMAMVFGVGDLDAKALQAKLAGRDLSCTVNMGDLSESVTGNAVPEETETLLQLVYMRFMCPRFDRQEFDRIIAQNKQLLPYMQNSLQTRIRDSVKVMKENYHPRVLLMDMDYLNKIDFGKIQQVYRERFSNAADFTFFITGNITAKELKPLVEKYIGSISSSEEREQWRDNGVRGPQGRMEKRIVMPFPSPQATVTVNVSKPLTYTCRNNICLQILKNVVQSRCMTSMREREGGVYAVNVYDESAYEPIGKYDLTVEFQCAPGNAERMKSMVFAEFDRLQQDAPTEGDLQKALANIRKKRGEAEGTNAFWMNAMELYYRTGIDMTSSENFDNVVKHLSATDFSKFVSDFMTDANIVDVVFTSGE